MRKLLGLLLLLFGLPLTLRGQSVQGAEAVIPYSGAIAYITPPNTPASNFSVGTGQNTFILSVSTSVAVRAYLINNTANTCSNITVTMWAAGDGSINTFNNSLQSWQLIPLQGSVTGLVQTVSPGIIPNGTTYVTSTAISAPKVALQVVNTVAGSCATTNIELNVVVTPVALVSPLVSSSGNGSFSNTPTNVQGIVPQGTNGFPTFPVVMGGLQLPTNTSANIGIDTITTGTVTPGTGGSGIFTVGTVSGLSKSSELVVAVENNPGDSGTGTVLQAPWTCFPALGCNAGNVTSVAGATLVAGNGQTYRRSYSNAQSGPDNVVFVAFSGSGASFRQSTGLSAAPSLTVLAGSALLAGFGCSTTCVINSITDTQGLTWRQISLVTGTDSIAIWAPTTVSAAGLDTLTVNCTGCSTNEWMVEISSPGVANPNQPEVSSQMDPIGINVIRQDAQSPNQFACTLTISTNTTTQLTGCAAPTTILGVPVRLYVTDIQINTTTAGTATTLTFKTGTGANCATGTANLSAIAYPNTVAALTNVIGFRTPLIAPVQTAVCVTQAGTTAGTSTIEVHVFLAP